jgi:peptidoglycan/xylan/chitin deacetylase (PgdA/CDA1 family)
VPRPRRADRAAQAAGTGLPWHTLAGRLRQDTPRVDDGNDMGDNQVGGDGRRSGRRHGRDQDRYAGRRRSTGTDITVRRLLDTTLAGRGVPAVGRASSWVRDVAAGRDVAQGQNDAAGLWGAGDRGPGATDAPRGLAGRRRRNGSHRAAGRLAAYRQPTLLLALVAAAVLLVADPPKFQDQVAEQAAAEQAQRQQAESGGREQAGGVPRPGKPAPGRPGSGSATPSKPGVAPPAVPAPAQPPAGASAGASTGASAPAEGAGPSATADPAAQATGPALSVRSTGSDAVALTFDDGPDPVQTPKLLDLLAKSGVKATFCVVGERAQAHPDLIRRIAAEGHALCNHSWNHDLQLGKLKPAEIGSDLARTTAAIRAAVPGAPVAYFRAPGGNFTPSLVTVAGAQGMRSIYWQVDPRDWEQPDSVPDDVHRKRIIAQVRQETTKGAIVLSHDFGQPQTIAAYAELLPYLKDRFRLIPLT